MFYEEEAYFRAGGYNNRYDGYHYHDTLDDVHFKGHNKTGRYCHQCGCHSHYRYENCRCACHSHHHRKRCNCGHHPCQCRGHRGYYCDCCHPGRSHHVCRELAWIWKEQRAPGRWKGHCGCTNAIQQLTASNHKNIIPFILVTIDGGLYVEWGRMYHYHRSYATVFFSIVKVNCRRNEAILELLKPNKSIIDPRTGRVEKWRVKEIDYVVPTGERVYVDLSPIREVRRFSPRFVKRRMRSF